MPWPTLVPPTPGTVITAAWESSMVNDPLLWLRLMTGNADPPGNDYVVISQGPSSTAWGKVGPNVLTPGAAQSNLGYVPAARAGDIVGDWTVSRVSSGTPADGVLYLGNTGGASYIARLGSIIYINGLPVSMSSNLSIAGTLTVVGGAVITNDVTIRRSTAPTTGYIFLGNTGNYLGYDGTRFVASGYIVWHSGNMGPSSGLNADMVDNYQVGNTSVNMIPFSGGRTGMSVGLNANFLEGSTKAEIIAEAIAGVVIPPASSPVPANMIAMFLDGMTPPAGWVIETRMANTVPAATNNNLGTGLFGSQGTHGGASAHAHTAADHAHVVNNHTHTMDHGHSVELGGGTGTTDHIQVGGGSDPNHVRDGHSHTGGTPMSGGYVTGGAPGLATGGSNNRSVPGDANNSLPPYTTVLFIRKSP